MAAALRWERAVWIVEPAPFSGEFSGLAGASRFKSLSGKKSERFET